MTHKGLLHWVLSRGAQKDWDSMSPAEQKRWTNRIIEHVIAAHREKLSSIPIGLTDTTLRRRRNRYIASVEQDIEDLSELAHYRMEGLSHWAQTLKLFPPTTERI